MLWRTCQQKLSPKHKANVANMNAEALFDARADNLAEVEAKPIKDTLSKVKP